jgi:hypothetical protein
MANSVLGRLGGPICPLVGESCDLINLSVAAVVESSFSLSHSIPIGRPDAVKQAEWATNPRQLS